MQKNWIVLQNELLILEGNYFSEDFKKVKKKKNCQKKKKKNQKLIGRQTKEPDELTKKKW